MLGIGSDRNLPTVLLIDDDVVSREVIATVLTLSGYMLHTAADGAESIRMLDMGTCVPEVILVDVQMEGLNGVKLIEELRTRSKASIYAISGSTPPDDLKSATDGFLLKPFGPDALQSLLAKHARITEDAGTAAQEPVVSAETLAQFRQMMPEPVVRQVYTAVAEDLRKRSVLLETAIAQGNAAEVRRIGHAIKGGCGMAGAREAARLGAMLESESDQLNNSTVVLRELQAATQNLERMLEVEFPA